MNIRTLLVGILVALTGIGSAAAATNGLFDRYCDKANLGQGTRAMFCDLDKRIKALTQSTQHEFELNTGRVSNIEQENRLLSQRILELEANKRSSFSVLSSDGTLLGEFVDHFRYGDGIHADAVYLIQIDDINRQVPLLVKSGDFLFDNNILYSNDDPTCSNQAFVRAPSDSVTNIIKGSNNKFYMIPEDGFEPFNLTIANKVNAQGNCEPISHILMMVNPVNPITLPFSIPAPAPLRISQ